MSGTAIASIRRSSGNSLIDFRRGCEKLIRPTCFTPFDSMRSFVVTNPTPSGPSRRDMMKQTGGFAVASALAGMTVPFVHAGESHTIQVALIGCGGRGTGAAENALATKQGPTKLV